MADSVTGRYIDELPGGELPITDSLKVILEGSQTGYNTILALAAFFNKHAHSNKALLDKFSVAGGQLMYDGQPVVGVAYKGFFNSSSSLALAFPAGQDGWYASVGSTNTMWLWDSDTSSWVDSGSAFTGVATEIHAAATKAAPADGDEFGYVDSQNSFSLKKLTWSAIKSALKSFFDGIYQVAGSYLTAVVVDGTTITGSGTAGDPLVASASGGGSGSAIPLAPATITIWAAGDYKDNQVKKTIAAYYDDDTKHLEQRFDWNADLSVSRIEIKDELTDVWVQRDYTWTAGIPSVSETTITAWTIV